VIRVFKALDRSHKRYLRSAQLEQLCTDLELPIACKVFDDIPPETWKDSKAIVAFACNLQDEFGNPAEGMVLTTDGGNDDSGEHVYMQARVLSSAYLLANSRKQKKEK
jgi:hypothetical protein